jgi:histidyl-tRNA synthetase
MIVTDTYQLPWEEVKKEMVEQKGLEEGVADTIGHYVKFKGAKEVLELIKSDEKLFASEDIKQGVEDMSLLFTYLEALGANEHISFDLSLARGLDYYTVRLAVDELLTHLLIQSILGRHLRSCHRRLCSKWQRHW